MSNSLQSHGPQPTRLLYPTGFSRLEYWNELPCPPPGDLPNPGIDLTSLRSPTLAGGFFTTSATRETLQTIRNHPRQLGKADSEEEGKMKECLRHQKEKRKKEEDINGAKLK